MLSLLSRAQFAVKKSFDDCEVVTTSRYWDVVWRPEALLILIYMKIQWQHVKKLKQ